MRYTTYQTAQLRGLLRQACIARDSACVRCGSTIGLETSHVLSKGAYRALQYDINNVLTLCHSCHHNFWHKYPTKALIWFIENYPEREESLRYAKVATIKLPDYISLKNQLNSVISLYQNN